MILTKTTHIFFNFTANNSAKPYMSNQKGHLIDKNKIGQGGIGKLWSINPLLAITHNTFFFIQLFAPLP